MTLTSTETTYVAEGRRKIARELFPFAGAVGISCYDGQNNLPGRMILTVGAVEQKFASKRNLLSEN